MASQDRELEQALLNMEQ